MYNVGQKNIPPEDKRDTLYFKGVFKQKSSGPQGIRQSLCP